MKNIDFEENTKFTKEDIINKYGKLVGYSYKSHEKVFNYLLTMEDLNFYNTIDTKKLKELMIEELDGDDYDGKSILDVYHLD